MSSSVTGIVGSIEQSHSVEATGRTTFLLPSVTRQKTESSSRYDQNERDFLFELLKRDVYAAFYEGCRARKREAGLSRADVAVRMGKDKTGISKLLSGPANWTLKTLSDAANAIDMDIKIVFCDRKQVGRYFDRTGLHIHSAEARTGKNYIDSMLLVGGLVSNLTSTSFRGDKKPLNNGKSPVLIDSLKNIDYVSITGNINTR